MIAEQRPQSLIHDRDTKFGRTFDVVFHGEGVSIIRTPLKAPNANAHIERWVGSLRRECLDRLLMFSRRQLARVLRVYVRHDNEGAHTAHELVSQHHDFQLLDSSERKRSAASCKRVEARCSSATRTRPAAPRREDRRPTRRIMEAELS
jgi:hypothetical protein